MYKHKKKTEIRRRHNASLTDTVAEIVGFSQFVGDPGPICPLLVNQIVVRDHFESRFESILSILSKIFIFFSFCYFFQLKFCCEKKKSLKLSPIFRTQSFVIFFKKKVTAKCFNFNFNNVCYKKPPCIFDKFFFFFNKKAKVSNFFKKKKKNLHVAWSDNQKLA